MLDDTREIKWYYTKGYRVPFDCEKCFLFINSTVGVLLDIDLLA